MESVLAGSTTLVGRLHVRRDNRVTDGTFALALEGTLDVPSEGQQAVDQISIGEHDHTLDRQQPTLPLLLVDEHAAATDDQCGLERVCGR